MKKLLFLLLLVASSSCSKDDSPGFRDLGHLKTCTGDIGCDDCVIVDKNLYNKTQTNNYDINEVKINGDCLEIRYSASGCSGSTWEVELIDLGAIAESNPVQRYVRLSLIDREDCEAYITKRASFNIVPLKVDDDELYLNIEGWEDLVLYSY